MDSLADLLDLQAVDLDIDRLLERRQGLPELVELAEVRERLRAAEEERDGRAAALRQATLDFDKAEGELDILERRLAESETRLYAGGMSSRETENKRLEVESLRVQQSGLEERVLVLLDDRERLEGDVAAVEARIAAIRAREAELDGAVATLRREIDLELGRREERKAGIMPTVPARLLGLYEELRRTKQGVAVGRLVDGQCGGCHLHLSPTEQREAAETDPPRCVHCLRILVR